jgi:outer membrane protein OmpA-like peptidoglycan-associated protein
MRTLIYHNLQVGLLILAFLLITGCAAALIGVGAGIGAAVYAKGKLIKTYRSEYHETVQASIDTLENLRIPIDKEISDELKTLIKATRPDGTPIRIEIVRIDKKLTEVGVRTGSIGVWDQKVSRQIQDIIGDRLSNKRAAAQSKLNDNRTSIKYSEPAKTYTIKKPSKDDFTIFFYHNSNEIAADQIEKLNRIAQRIIEMPNAKVILNGYTDSSGDANYNKMISESRTASVQAYLIGKGVEPGDIKIFGHGAKDFISNNNTIRGRNKNRRVEIVIFP